MSRLLGIIADDLTGANDSGVQLTEKGVKTSVLFDIPEHSHNLDSGLVIDTNSRALSNQEARSITKQAALFLKEAGYRYVYKKMDSTLRGHIATELQALSEVFSPEFVIIAPALPAYGRTTKDGVHYVNGIKLSETEAAKDPKHPVRQSYIPSLIEDEIDEAVGLLTTEDIKGSTLQAKLQSYQVKNIQYIVCDAESQEELLQMAQQVVKISENIIWAGSAGLAEVLPEVLGISQKMGKHSLTKSEHVMTVCGSLSQVTQHQVRFAAEQADVTAIELDPIQMFTNDWEMLKDNHIEKCVDVIKSGDDIVVYVPSNEQIRDKVKRIGRKRDLSDYQIGEHISQSIGEIVVGVSERNKNLSGLVLTGGDTAKEVARQLGGIGFRLLKQLEAGIPVGTLIGTEKEFRIVTKAGAFGNQQSIYHAMQVLKGVLNNE